MVITLSGTFVVLRHAAQTRHYDSRNKSVEIISQVTSGFFFIMFFFLFFSCSLPLVLSGIPSSPPSSSPHLPHRIFLPVSPVTSRPSLQQQHRGRSPLGKKRLASVRLLIHPLPLRVLYTIQCTSDQSAKEFNFFFHLQTDATFSTLIERAFSFSVQKHFCIKTIKGFLGCGNINP